MCFRKYRGCICCMGENITQHFDPGKIDYIHTLKCFWLDLLNLKNNPYQNVNMFAFFPYTSIVKACKY
ncbi:hypothetical protein JHK82_013915 [Glycine max]|uniref:Uncharacterized protein n=2 Tax=Glycine subgen. Soja TaxID=1462606 RepID=K7KRF0_SOYBN|nr:hypothetical protein JHK86_013924 [Glycine max]KAG5155946.1 hypothetical protein JHK82_013915 [Glycine max]KAH1079856.1 hypothetical protein GYH30_057003 [Glycine max]KRH60531.1 hypothetical protein GLYMA_05G245700v4 [Glycine max]RZC14155.1 hypothetical protein D0Y65_013268 [Glycine soja]